MTSTAQAITQTIPPSAEMPIIIKWLWETSAQAIGAAVGALVAYVGGYKLLQRQIAINSKLERERQESIRKKYMKIFFDETEVIRRNLGIHIIDGINTSKRQDKESLPGLLGDMDRLNEIYREYRIYFTEDQVLAFKGFYSHRAKLEQVIGRYSNLRAANPKDEEIFSSMWPYMLEMFTSALEAFDNFDRYDPNPKAGVKCKPL